MRNALADIRMEAFVAGEESNPLYQFRIYDEGSDTEAFFRKYIHLHSTVYTSSLNPEKDFIALMVCDHADQYGPDVPGEALRVSLP